VKTCSSKVVVTNNFAAASFHAKKLWQQTSFDRSWILLAKTAKSRFGQPFGGLGVNVHGSTMAHWKARGRLPISATWTFFASCHGWGAMTGYWSQFSCLKGGGSLSGGNRLFQDYWRLKTRVPGLSRGVVCVISRFRTIPAWKRYAQTDTQRRLILAHS